MISLESERSAFILSGDNTPTLVCELQGPMDDDLTERRVPSSTSDYTILCSEVAYDTLSVPK